MSKQAQTLSSRPYVIGFVLSLVTTLAAYWIVTHKVLSGWSIVYAVLALATAQFVIQAIYFLHLKDDSKKPYWKNLVFIFTILVVLIVVIGSLWIMKNLNYNMMPTKDVNKYLESQDGL